MLPADALHDLNEGRSVYLNVRIYVADRATPDEIAAAANVAVRLTFEIHSMDLPIGFPMSKYDNSESSVAIIIGSAARRFSGIRNDSTIVATDGSRSILAFPDVRDAERFARTLGSELAIQDGLDESDSTRQKSFTLSSLFSSEGLLGDEDGDRIPELTETTVVLGPDVHSVEVIDFAARIAFEAAGCRLPLVVTDALDRLPPNPVLIGRSNRHLRNAGYFDRARQPLEKGQGRIEIIAPANGRGSIVVIAGADDAGEAAALSHAAERLPFVWTYGKEHLHLSDIEKDLRQFFSNRSTAGQAAAALCRARESVARIRKEEATPTRLDIFVDGSCRPCLDYMATQFPDIEVNARNLNSHSGPLIFEETHHLPWEVDDARRRIAKFLVPAVHPGSRVEIDLRISESPEIRASLNLELRNLLVGMGADPASLVIHVIAAHKQAYCWIDEILKPRLKAAARIQIQYRKIISGSPLPVESTRRWLHELYPIDEVLSRDLGIPLDRITFKEVNSDQAATYEVHGEDASGQSILRESFEPRFALRNMFDAIPHYAQVRVNTGWLHARVDGSVVADEQIETDPERFWNRYQSSTLPKIREHIQQLYDGNPMPESGPHFGTLEVDLWLSEPDYRIGIGEERISTLEALHEDIYFETLLFFEILGLSNPGRVIPRIHRARDGQDGLARIRFIGKAGPNPRMNLHWKDQAGKSHRNSEGLSPVRNGNPQITGVTVQSGHSAVVCLEVTGVQDTKESLALLQTVQEFHEQGVGLNWFSYEYVDALRFGSTEIRRTGSCFNKPCIEPLQSRAGSESPPIVQWDTPIGPDECEQLIGKLAAFPEVRAFHAGSSYLGHPIWALELAAPSKGKFISQARAIVSKPVLFITGRQHANEVSSTSHILRLAELLATDSETRKLLDHVHFILQPIVNADGAALIEELCRDTPGFMLHAGYLGALGADVTSEQWSENPLYPEAHVRPYLWRMWLPDIVLNPHGYPSHEWVQLFAGYTAWVKSRSVTARDWWIPRGWFIPGFTYMEESRDAALKLRDHVTGEMRARLGPWNDQMYRRYTKYGAGDPEVFKTQFCNGMLVYSQSTGLQQKSDGFTFMQRHPEITLLETVTEVPDEVAQGDWLKTLAQAGLEFSLANAKFLAETCHQPERTIRHTAFTTILKIRRSRPWKSVP